MKQQLQVFAPVGGNQNTPDALSAVRVSIIVPAFQEAQNLPELAVRLFAALSIAEWNAELIIVDDNSEDGTLEICEGLAEFFPLRLITRTNERGLATAVIRGLQQATGDYVVVMDADLSHPPESVPLLLNALQTSPADFVIGSRYIDGGSVDESWSFFRRLNSRVAGWLAGGLTTAKDPMAGFFAVRAEKLQDLSGLNPCGYKIGLEILVRCGCRRVTEVPIHFEDRRYGKSKLSPREQWLYICHLSRLYGFRYPEVRRLAAFGGVGVSGLAVDMLLFHCLLPVAGLATGRAFAIWAAMMWNFFWNRRVTFSEVQSSRPVPEYLRFCTVCLSGAVISWATALGLVAAESVRAAPIPAALVGTCVAAVVNYALCRLWVFGRHRQPRLPVILKYPEMKSVVGRGEQIPSRIRSSA